MQHKSLLKPEAAGRAIRARQTTGHKIDIVLSQLGLISETALSQAIADFLDLKITSAENFPDSSIADNILDQKFLETAKIIPLKLLQDRIELTTTAPFENEAIKMISFFLDREVKVQVSRQSEFDAAFSRLYGQPDDIVEDHYFNEQSQLHSDDVERLKDSASQAPIIKLVMRMIADAVERGASDIHIEPSQDKLNIRFRLDGHLQPIETIDKAMQSAVTSRIKILAKLNIAERRLPQDGRIKLVVKGREIDFRVSTTPTLFGESIVMRILDKSELDLSFTGLGYSRKDADFISELISFANGVVLVTGPTGSGKTTSLYAALTSLNSEKSKLFSVEDPVEYQLEGVNQVQVQPQIDLDFSRSLRSILRQDPDVIMVGEIRDAETARIVIQAALTGHMVMSTVHTNSAVATLPRLADMGIEDFLLTSTLRGIIAQRLVRKTCKHCQTKVKPREQLLNRLSVDKELAKQFLEQGVWQGTGCLSCLGTGYRGRTTIYEILSITPSVQDGFLAGGTGQAIVEIARNDGFTTLQENGISKVAAGETTLDEVMRASLVI